LPTTTHAGTQASALTDSSVVRFAQTVASIPVFGSHIVVEVGANDELIGVDAEVASVRGTPTEPSLDAAAAAAKVAELVGVEASEIVAADEPWLVFYSDESERWHLAWLLPEVAHAPPDFRDAKPHKGHRSSPRRRNARLDYLVDAHDGEVLFYYSLTPGARRGGPPQVPVKCRGRDASAIDQEFYGLAVHGGFELYDPLQRTRTYDFRGGDTALDTELPELAVRSESADFGPENAAAVSAHVNVARVLDFLRAVLKRNGVDDEGMEVVSIVNCVDSESEDPPEWGNAIWWQNKMWYGQQRVGDALLSYSTRLDVIGHELTHGVIEHTSGLIYKNQSGALNESFADIFGIIIANWYEVGPDSDVGDWSWEFLAGLGEDGGPVRDLSNPKRTGDPDHMDDLYRGRDDEGGVHVNSNIHNKAAYNVLTARRGSKRVFTPRDVAVLYYLCLMRLPQAATFKKALRVLLDVTAMIYSGDAEDAERRVEVVRAAYEKVGITVDEDW
ncbi:MAG: M4 family metallopeptidase, partial [Myxococcales bacterium]|nr:M4 family metallopeptidase [Myxococcales bacterium]